MSDIPEDMQAVFDDIDNETESDSTNSATQDHQQTIETLAKLTVIEYEKQRTEKATELSIRAPILDKLVYQKRAEFDAEEVGEAVESLELWPHPVTANRLLSELTKTITNHVLLQPGQANTLAWWVLGSYCMDGWRLFPKVLITSPEKRCGKSTLLETLEGIVYRPLLASNITPSAIFRCIEAWEPTLLLDEADTFTKDNDQLNGIINSGHTKRTARVIRTEAVADGFVPRSFSTWCPQVIAGIGSQRGTLHDRSLHIELTRALPGQKPAKLPANYFEAMTTMRRKCARWAWDNLDEIKRTTAEVPACGNDRAEDNWHPLFVLAKLAGDKWPETVQASYLILTQKATDDEESAGHLLIQDISDILKAWPYPDIFSKTVVDSLIKLEDRPWCEWRRGKPLTQNSLARLLKPYHLVSGSKRIGGATAKGFKVEDMQKAFKPYLPAEAEDGEKETGGIEL